MEILVRYMKGPALRALTNHAQDQRWTVWRYWKIWS